MEAAFDTRSHERSGAYGLGARRDGDTVIFRVWAPTHQHLDLVLYKKDGVSEMASLPMEREGNGHFSARFEASPRLLYKYRVDGQGPFPDPASRSQPFGVHGPSEVADARFAWLDAGWKGLALDELVIYEVHVGTATDGGTFESLIPRLSDLKALGVTAIELMPIASFPGRRNWGYDGVGLFAPQHSYGGGFGLRRLVDAAHRLGLAVLLDVVYNHLGPDGNYLRSFSPNYFTDHPKTPWGEAIDLSQAGVREFFFENAAMWIRDYHLDGLRLDATHALADDREPLFLREVADRARAAGAGRKIHVIAEDERNERKLVVSPLKEKGGVGLDAVWADDFHHQMRRALAGDKDGYYRDYGGTAAEIAATVRDGWFYQGQRSEHLGRERGTRQAGIEPPRFIHCLQNHDQIGNRALGDRLGASVEPAAYRAASALLLLSPATPLLFMGQEWNATTPFLYFTDHREPLGKAVREGRAAEFKAFSAWSGARVPDPQAESTFERSVLRWEERDEPEHKAVLALYRELLALRAQHPALRPRAREQFEAAAISETAVALKRKGLGSSEVLVVMNLRGVLRHAPAGHYRLLIHTNDPRYGGGELSGGGFVEGEVRMEGPGAVVLELVR